MRNFTHAYIVRKVINFEKRSRLLAFIYKTCFYHSNEYNTFMYRNHLYQWFGFFWGIIGFYGLLLFALWRITPRALETTLFSFNPLETIGVLLFVAFMVYFEGYRGFYKKFSPRFASRLVHFLDSPRSVLQTIFAPLYAMAFFHAPPAAKRAAWITALSILAAVLVVQQLTQPLRGIIGVGVVAGLLVGMAATAFHVYRFCQHSR